jgi:hypothetical protein
MNRYAYVSYVQGCVPAQLALRQKGCCCRSRTLLMGAAVAAALAVQASPACSMKCFNCFAVKVRTATSSACTCGGCSYFKDGYTRRACMAPVLHCQLLCVNAW